MLWYKMVSSDGYESQPMWMEVRGNNIYITGASGMSWDGNYWNFFLDTLIRKADVMNLPESERKPPYKNSRWTFFARLDLDGHVQERHFIEAYSRELIFGELRQVLPLCIGRRYRTPMHVDDMGNVHLFARFYYTGEENNPYTIVIDGDTNRTIDLYLPGGSCNEQPRFNVMVYKFAPNWELEFARLMIEHTEGIASSWEFTYDSIYPSFSPFVEGLSFDEQDNMYVSGYIKITMSSSDHGGNLHQYPIHIYWDSTHYATIQDMSSARRLNYLIKYNPQGEVQWCNQIYTRGSSEGSNRASAVWGRNCLHGNYLYLNGKMIRKNLPIPESLTSIGNYAFSKCLGFTSITIPNSVTSIGYNAFAYCFNTTSISIGNSVKRIGDCAFSYCTGLKDMYCYAEQVPEIGNDIFIYSNQANATLHVPA